MHLGLCDLQMRTLGCRRGEGARPSTTPPSSAGGGCTDFDSWATWERHTMRYLESSFAHLVPRWELQEPPCLDGTKGCEPWKRWPSPALLDLHRVARSAGRTVSAVVLFLVEELAGRPLLRTSARCTVVAFSPSLSCVAAQLLSAPLSVGGAKEPGQTGV